jgi:fumarate reductase subunit D
MSACEFEANVLRAVAEDRWSDSLRTHLIECEDCVAAVSVAPWMTQFARIGDREHILPDPAIVWLKAQLLGGSAEAARASRPITFMQFASYLVVAGGWAALLTWKWDVIEAWVAIFTPTGLIESAARAQTFSMSFVGMLFVLATITFMVALHTMFAEE